MKTTRHPQPALLSVLVEAIADHKGIAPDDPDFCLYDETDPEALELLIENTAGPVTTEFRIDDAAVTVEKTTTGSLNVEVTPTATQPPAAD